MNYLLVWPEHLEAAARDAAPLSGALGGRLKLIGTSQLADMDRLPFGTYLFCGASVASGRALLRLKAVETSLLAGGARVLNGPSSLGHPMANLTRARGPKGNPSIGGLGAFAGWDRYPAVLRSYSQTFVLDSPPLLDCGQLREAAGRMVLSGCDPESLWVLASEALSEPRPALLHLLRLGGTLIASADERSASLSNEAKAIALTHAPEASLTTFFVSEGSLVPWRIDDSAGAILAGSAESGESLRRVVEAWHALLPESGSGDAIPIRLR